MRILCTKEFRIWAKRREVMQENARVHWRQVMERREKDSKVMKRRGGIVEFVEDIKAERKEREDKEFQSLYGIGGVDVRVSAAEKQLKALPGLRKASCKDPGPLREVLYNSERRGA